jgi:hypothetical protein
MMPMVVSALTEWRKECPKGELGLAFPNTLGKVEMHTNVLKRGWYPTQLAAWVLDRSGESALREEGDKFCELRPRKVQEADFDQMPGDHVADRGQHGRGCAETG